MEVEGLLAGGKPNHLGAARSRTAKKILAMGPQSRVLEITPEYMATWKY